MELATVKLVLAGLLLALPAALRSEPVGPGNPSAVEDSSSSELSGDILPTRISTGRAADLVGMPRYADRSESGAGAMLVTFSKEPVVRLLRRPGSVAGSDPVAGARMSSPFGYRRHPITGAWRMHSGVDLAAPLGTPVVAAQSGKVRSASWRGGYGLLVVLEHEDGGETRYAHLSRITVASGQAIAVGETLGFVGASGNATGPHLHFERRSAGRAYDPLGH